jgi:hypothetical protein
VSATLPESRNIARSVARLVVAFALAAAFHFAYLVAEFLLLVKSPIFGVTFWIGIVITILICLIPALSEFRAKKWQSGWVSVVFGLLAAYIAVTLSSVIFALGASHKLQP